MVALSKSVEPVAPELRLAIARAQLFINDNARDAV
jgi:hypothetical protein